MREPVRKITADHHEIRRWAETHGGKAGRVKRSPAAAVIGDLRVIFPGTNSDLMEEISWGEFFAQLEDQELAVLYLDDPQDDTPFYRFVDRNHDFESTLKSFDDEAPMIPIGAEKLSRQKK